MVKHGERMFKQCHFPDNLGRTMAAVGAGLFLLYMLTLSPGVFPGESSAWVSSALGHSHWKSAAHPLWRLSVFLWQRIPWGSPVWRLNLSSAVCGSVAAALLCRYVACWVYARLRKLTENENASIEGKAQAEEKKEPTVEEVRVLRSMSRIAVASGGGAAVLFGTGLASWSAATRFQPETFGFVLVMAAFLLYQDYTHVRGTWRLYVLALLCGMGVVETVLFWVAVPFLAVAVIAFLYRHHRLRFGLCLGLLATGVLGLGLYVLSARTFTLPASVLADAATGWHVALRQMVKLQLKEVQFFLPRAGWTFVLILLVVPWLAFQSGYWERLHNQRNYRADALQIACLIVVVLLQFGVPIPPWPLWRHMGRLPVLEAAVAAMLGGWACAYWAYGVLFRWEPDKLVDGKELRQLEKSVRIKRWLSVGVCSTVLVLAVTAALCNAARASGRRGVFADRCAQEILDQLDGRSWLVTDGVLDTHLTVLAAARGKTLHVLNLAAERDAEQVRRLCQWVAEEPRMQANRERLLNAARLGVGSFVREWLTVDPESHQWLALYGVPDFWTEAGLTIVPDRFLFLAVRSPDSLLTRPLLEEQRAFWKRMVQLLPLSDEDRDVLDSLRHLLRRHLSLVANDLGVLLIDLGRPAEAYDACQEALVLEPENLSAQLNMVELVRGGLHSEMKEELEVAIKEKFATFKRQPTFFEIIRLYGQIHSPLALASRGAAWAKLGQYGLAEGAMQRAQGLAKDEKMRTDIQGMLAGVRLMERDMQQTEADFRALLEIRADNPDALQGMLNLALLRGDTADARAWLEKARRSGADETALALSEARIEIAERKYDACCTRLLALTDKMPKNLDAWALLAEVMFRQGRATDAELKVLPYMESIVGKQPNALVFQVRGAVASAKGADSYGIARDAYRCALALMPGQRDILQIILDLDLKMGDDAAAGKDASDLLRVDRDNPRAHFVLGTQSAAIGDIDAAEWHLRKSVAGDGTAVAWNNLAGLLLNKGILDEAEKAARQAVAKSDTNAAFLDTLADALLQRGKVDEAMVFIGQARSLAPQDWQVAFTAARILKQLGRQEEARVLMRQVQEHLDALPPPVQVEVTRIAKEWKSKR